MPLHRAEKQERKHKLPIPGNYERGNISMDSTDVRKTI